MREEFDMSKWSDEDANSFIYQSRTGGRGPSDGLDLRPVGDGQVFLSSRPMDNNSRGFGMRRDDWTGGRVAGGQENAGGLVGKASHVSDQLGRRDGERRGDRDDQDEDDR
jgi:hypothetical protein